MQLRAERFEVDETTARCVAAHLSVIPERAHRANPESRERALLLDSGAAPSKLAVADLDNDIAELG
jgi:hypothetical protein